MSRDCERSQRAWYRQPYLWLVLSPLLVIIVADLALVVYMGRAGSGVLPGAESRVGKLVTADERAPVEAIEMLRSPAGWRIEVEPGNKTSPASLALDFIHPVLSDRDFSVRLARGPGGGYHGRVPATISLPLNGRLHLRSSDGEWAWLVPYELHNGNLVLQDQAP